MISIQSIPIKFKKTFLTMKELCSEFSLQYKTLERFIKEEKEKGFDEFFIEGVKYSVVPGRIKIPGVRNYIWNANIFYLYYFLPKINGVEKPQLKNGELIFISQPENRIGVN